MVTVALFALGVVVLAAGLGVYAAAFETNRDEFAFLGPALILAGLALMFWAADSVPERVIW